MYQSYPSLVLGFHGCDRNIAENLLNKRLEIKKSDNQYDWLGSGMYFWENAPTRADDYAMEVKKNPKMGNIKDPFVIGAVIDLGYCFNLLDHQNLNILKTHHDLFIKIQKSLNRDIPKNTMGSDKLMRYLDRAVIEFTHAAMENDGRTQLFDSVRAVFFEGQKLYEDAGFREKNHIQLCIRNPNCIKGFFLPRELSNTSPRA